MSDALLLILLRYATAIGWAIVIVRLFPRTRRAFTKAAERDDPIFAVVAGFGIVSIMFASRYLIFNSEPDNPAERAFLMVAYLFLLSLQIAVLRFDAWGRHDRN